ncbi:MAG: hypothetical protein JNL11_04545 [Bdellovibrionaceae bacterium]|nr:hypothetical protein [Pseudobdellovibrionaceae bacterium]
MKSKASKFISLILFNVLVISHVSAQQFPNINTKTDDDLYPIQVVDPNNPITGLDPQLPGDPNNPNIPTIPGIPTLPSVPGTVPIGNIGSSFNPIFGGTTNTQMQIAQVPNEFYCPLFESNPYDAIFRALDSLSTSMKLNPECQQQAQQYTDFYSDSEKIRNLVTQLQQMQTDPNIISTTSTRDVERVITDAVSGVTNIANNLSNNKLLNKNCGPSKTSIGKGLLAVNDILNNLAPVGLVLAAANPSIGIAAKVALMGGVYATTAIKGFDQYARANSLDLSNSEVRKAILQNTCQFVKVKQKIDFLQLGEEGRLNDIQGNLFKNIEAYRARYNNSSSTLLPLMQYKYQTEKIISDLEAKIAEDKYNLNFYNAKIKGAGDDKERICLIGSSLVKKSKDAETFPASALRILETAVEASKLGSTSSDGITSTGTVDPEVQTESEELYLAFNKARNRLNVLTAKALSDNISEADQSIALCAEETKTWIKRIYEIVVYSDNLTNKEIKEIENLLLQSDEYKVWNAQFVKLKAEKSSMSRVIKVLKEMARPDAVYIRSELNQRVQELKASLFRSNNLFGFSTSKAPVTAWLDNNLEQHRISLSKFTGLVKLLQQGTFNITKANGRVLPTKITVTIPPVPANNPAASAAAEAEQDKKILQDLNTLSRLENLNLKTLKQGSDQHEYACQQLQEAYIQYRAAKDYLGSAQFMCDMIDPYISDTSDQIISLCRGGKTFNSKEKSKIQSQYDKMKVKSSKALSLDDYGKLMSLKRSELKCPLPSLSTID